MTYVYLISAAVLLGGGIFLEYRYAPLAWVMGKIRKAAS